MDKLKKLLSKCNGGLYISINEHKDETRTSKEFISDRLNSEGVITEADSVNKDVIDKIIETNNLIEISVNSENPIYTHIVFHYDLDLAIDEAIKCLDSI